MEHSPCFTQESCPCSGKQQPLSVHGFCSLFLTADSRQRKNVSFLVFVCVSSEADNKSFPNHFNDNDVSITLRKAVLVNSPQCLTYLLLPMPCPSSMWSFRVTAQPGTEKTGLQVKLYIENIVSSSVNTHLQDSAF